MSENYFINKLLGISAQIGQNKSPLSGMILNNAGILRDEFERILDMKNGFIAFESALQFFHSGNSEGYVDINDWNDPSLWIDRYPMEIQKYVFFAQDIFGTQFIIYDDAIHIFEPETQKIEYMAENFESWAEKILGDFDFFTGRSLAHEWQIQKGQLGMNIRLVPKIPFVCNGAYEIANLFESEMVESMRMRADFSRQIKNLPDGSKIEFDFSSL